MHEDHIATLKTKRRKLQRELLAIEDRLDDEPSKDWEDRSAERQGDEVLEALGTHDLEELRKVDAALARAEMGTYGTCVRCGAAISAERLDALPETPHCKTCALSLVQ